MVENNVTNKYRLTNEIKEIDVMRLWMVIQSSIIVH